ncbi:MAG: hypothetical protein EPN82_09895 [Bacteroidetes bacterium]|nr:MAG: hypothetical protein EPN82_09895 [Bacteroidota bacterium]
MKKIFLFTSLLLIFCFGIALSKEFKFCVLGKKGTVQVKTSHSKKTEEVKTGDKLFLNDNLIIGDGSYIGLVHSNGKTIEISKPGSYKISELSSSAEGRKTSVFPKLAEMIFNNVSKKGSLLTDKSNKSEMKTGGYIERGIGEVNLPIVSPLKNHFINRNITLCWNSYKDNSEYVFKLMNRFNKVLLTKTSTDTCISFDAESLKLEKGIYYFWVVNLASDTDYKSHEACFRLLSDNEIVTINDTLKELKEEMGVDNTAASNIVYAFFYEQNNLYDEAANAYKQAINMAPGVYDYVVLYEGFLSRTKSSEK